MVLPHCIYGEQIGKDIDLPAEATGRFGTGLLGFFDANLQRDGDLLVEMLNFEDAIKRR